MAKITKQEAIQAIIDSDKAFLTPADIAPILGVNPDNIRLAARQRPELLKFEFTVIGNRTKIPRIPFLRYIGINVDTLPHPKDSQAPRTLLEYESMTNEQLLLAVIHEINTAKQEILARLDAIDQQSQDINNLLQAARNIFRALSNINTSE